MRASAFISASAGILLVLLLLSSGCGQRPASGSNTSFQPFWTTTVAPAGGTPVPTTPDVGVVVEITEIPVKPTTPVPPPTEEVTYVEIYNKELLFKYNTTALEYDLKYPPLIIDFTLKPEIVNRVTVTRDPTCTPTDTNLCLKTVTVTYPDPSAWFTITVKYLGSDQIVAQSGYNREYDVSEEKRLTIRQPGYYHIEMTGSRLSAVVRMRVTTVTT
jgi:hypothetical protein